MSRFFLFLLLLQASLPAQSPPEGGGERKELHPKNSAVKLRLLTKPFAKIYKDRSCKEDAVAQTPAAFTVLHVTQAPSGGNSQVYEVADSTGLVLGYLPEADAVPWKQALCLQFEHQGNRDPVLMFDRKEPLLALTGSSEDSRVTQAAELHVAIREMTEDKVLPEGFPVVSVEPKRMIDSSAATMIIPIVDFDEVEMGEEENRLLQIAIAANRGVPRGATTLQDKDYAKAASQAADAASADQAPVEILFCFDATGSMQNYLDICTTVAREVGNAFGSNPRVGQRVRFGVWAYQDQDPGREFHVHNFTPQMVPVAGLAGALQQVRASRVNAGDVPEDLLGGVSRAAMEGWSGDAQGTIRIMVLFGDAPGHDGPGNPRNSSQKMTSEVKALLDGQKVYVYAVHIQDPGATFTPFHSVAEGQMRTLAGSSGLTAARESYVAVRGDSAQEFQRAMNVIYQALDRLINQADSLLQDGGPAKDGSEGAEPTPEIVANDLFRAALVDWIGRNSKDAPVPNDLTVWISEKDLRNAQPAVRPSLLVSKVQLAQLTTTMELVLQAGVQGLTTGRDFFSSLQSVAAVAVRDPGKLNEATSLKEAGLIPEFIQGLPYKSRILNLTNDLWSSWPPTQQEKFLEEVQSRINLYKDIHNTTSRWVALDGQASTDDHVTTLPLEQLP